MFLSSVCCASSSTCCLHHFISPSPTLSSPVRSAELYLNSQKERLDHATDTPCVLLLSCSIFSLYGIFRFHAVIQKSAIFLKPTPFPFHSSLSMLFSSPSPPLLSLYLLLLLPLFPASSFPKSCRLLHPQSTSHQIK